MVTQLSRMEQMCQRFSSTTIVRNSDKFSAIFLFSGLPVSLLKFSFIFFFFFSLLQNFVQLFLVFFLYISTFNYFTCKISFGHDVIILNLLHIKIISPFFFYNKSPPLNLFHKLVKCISTIYFVGRSYSVIHVIPNPMQTWYKYIILFNNFFLYKLSFHIQQTLTSMYAVFALRKYVN